MLFTLKLPSFNTILHNGKQQFVLYVLRSGNNLIDTIRVLILVSYQCSVLCLSSFTVYFTMFVRVYVFHCHVCYCTCLSFMISHICGMGYVAWIKLFLYYLNCVVLTDFIWFYLIYPVLILFCGTLPVNMYFIRACLCAVALLLTFLNSSEWVEFNAPLDTI